MTDRVRTNDEPERIGTPLSSGLTPVDDPDHPMRFGYCLDPTCRQSGPTHLHGDKWHKDECVGIETDVAEVERLLDEDFDVVRSTTSLLAQGWTVAQLEACARLARQLADEVRTGSDAD